MKHQEDDDEAGAEVMQPSHEAPGRRRIDETNAVVGVVGSRRIVDREECTSEDLNGQQPEQDAAEREQPASASREWFVEQNFPYASGADSVIEPVADPIDHKRTRTDLSEPSIRAWSRSSGLGGGPPITRPSASYAPP